MKVGPVLAVAALCCMCMSSCARTLFLQDIWQVSHTEESGTIPPELQLTEQIVITSNKVTLTRRGRVEETMVNEGTWEWDVDEREVRALFDQLEAIDCSSIKRVEPAELEIGGGTQSYRMVYGGDRTFYLSYGGGVTYTDGMLIVEPIDAFVKGLVFPVGAANQYKSSPDQP